MNERHLELCSSAEWAETVQRWIIPWVLDGVDLGDDVLEVGPGPGRTTEVLAQMSPRLTAVEVDPELAASLAARLGGPSVEVLRADATALPLPDGRFSSALSFTMLHHVPSAGEQDQLFAEVARVLRPGGIFAGTDSLATPELAELHSDDTYVPIDPDGLEERLVGAGFSEVRVDTNEYAVRFRAVARA
ncbi:MAG TPA: class I SAM-dependent methyltransferase [Acidimicrobiales bacterium]|nr:class I SAM-dependent methyltransferase [Acidimicrobiales bacterium]